MGWGKFVKKLGKFNKNILRVAAAAVTAGGSEIGGRNSLASKVGKEYDRALNTAASLDPVEQKKVKQAERAQAAAAEQQAQKEAADRYKASILGQRSQRLEDALSSQTDFTGDEEQDPRELITRPEVSKKKKLIGF